MASFCAKLAERSKADDELPLPLEMLAAHSDFEAFKAMMLSVKAGRAAESQSGPLCVSGAGVPLHADEQEDGEEMPDLCLSISSAASPGASPAKPPPSKPAAAKAPWGLDCTSRGISRSCHASSNSQQATPPGCPTPLLACRPKPGLETCTRRRPMSTESMNGARDDAIWRGRGGF